MPAIVINFLAFQASFFACVLGGASGWPWLGVVVVVGVVALHVFQSPRASQELRLIAAAAVVGTLWDSALVATGVVVYPSGQLSSMLAPVWIVALWVGFATCLNVTLRWLRSHWLIGIVVGAVAGPLAFSGGARLGAVEFADPVLSRVVLSLGWAAIIPLLLWVARRCDGWAPGLEDGQKHPGEGPRTPGREGA